MNGHLIELASLVVMLVFLAITLSAVGWGLSKLLHHHFDSRREEQLRTASRIEAAKSRAAKRAAVRA